MQFRWNHTQGAPDYDRETGFGFVTGAVYTADAALHIPETNSGFLPLWWYAAHRFPIYGRANTACSQPLPRPCELRTLPTAACRCGCGSKSPARAFTVPKSP